jgi:hypothetical protein
MPIPNMASHRCPRGSASWRGVGSPSQVNTDGQVKTAGNENGILAKEQLLITVTTEDAKVQPDENEANAWRVRLGEVLSTLKGLDIPPARS